MLDIIHNFLLLCDFTLVSRPSQIAVFLKPVDLVMVAKMKAKKRIGYGAWDQLAIAILIKPELVLQIQRHFSFRSTAWVADSRRNGSRKGCRERKTCATNRKCSTGYES